MPCELNRSALVDVAAGSPAPAAVEAHLAACPACRAELRRLRDALALVDAALGDLATAEPSPALRARIRQSVAAARGPRLALPWPWAWATAAAVVVALASAAPWRTGPARPVAVAPPAVATTTAAPPSLTSVPLTTTMAVGEPPAASSAIVRAVGAAPAAPARPLRRQRREPEVLVPPGGLDALVRLATLAHEERVGLTLLATAGEPLADLAEPLPIEITPLEIVPLDPAESPGT